MKRILVVDDDAANRYFMAVALRQSGYEVVEAKTGLEALEITEQEPHLARLLWLSTLLDTAITREWVVGMGRLTSAQHLAHLICELYVRLKIIGHADRSFALPFTQSDLGDALGLSVVHVNRKLQELRGAGLVEWRDGRVKIKDFDRLAELARKRAEARGWKSGESAPGEI